MSVFRRHGRDRVLVQLPPHAAGLLASLAAQLIELLSDGDRTRLIRRRQRIDELLALEEV